LVNKTIYISIIRPHGYIHSSAFMEVAETLMFGLRHLGFDVSVNENYVSSDYPTILLGWNLLSEDILARLPEKTVIYNLEQLHDQSPWIKEKTFDILKKYTVWDYNLSNLAYFQRAAITSLFHVPIGYVPEMTRVHNKTEQTIDVLFYGSLNERRKQVLDALAQAGLKVHAAFGVYGAERDKLIGNSKVVLNIHFYPTNVFEIVRVGYLLSNFKAVISEDSNLIGEDDIKGSVKFARYDQLVSSCLDLVRNIEERKSLELSGYLTFSARKETDILQSAISTL